MNPILTKILQWGILTIVMAGSSLLIARARNRNNTADTGNRLTVPVYALVIGIIDALLFAIAAVASNLWSDGGASIGTTAVFSVLSLSGVYLIVAYFVEKHSYDEARIVYAKISGRTAVVLWSEIERVKYSAGAKWFVVKDGKNRKYRFSRDLRGLGPFAATMIRKVAAEKIDSNTTMLLRRLEIGQRI